MQATAKGRTSEPIERKQARQPQALSEAATSETKEATDREIIDRVRKGDRQAFELLYDRYFKRIYRFVDRRMGIRADVEETTQ